MANEIEFPSGPTQSTMTMDVPDNWPAPPEGPPDTLVASEPCEVIINWTIPSPHSTMMGGSFELKAYVESIGPGPEMQLGTTATVPVVPGQNAYTQTIPIAANTLLGEGELHAGVAVSGVYKIIAVLQHVNGAPTPCSGFAEESLKFFRSP